MHLKGSPIATCIIWISRRPGTRRSLVLQSPESWFCSDEGLAIEKSAFESLHGGQFMSSAQLINQIFSCTAILQSKVTNDNLLSQWAKLHTSSRLVLNSLIYLCVAFCFSSLFSSSLLNKLEIQVLHLCYMNPLTPKSDQCLISPCSNTAQSNIKVVRKKGSDQQATKILIIHIDIHIIHNSIEYTCWCLSELQMANSKCWCSSSKVALY